MIIARPVAQRREWPQPRSARAIRQATALGTPTPAPALWARTRAREPTQWPHACDRRRATHRALLACPPSYADYILRLQDTKPESLEIMLRLWLVAFPLVVALPAAFDRQEANAFLSVVQTTLQLEVRSPPESRPLLPAAARDQHTTAPPHTPLRTHNTQAHTSPCTRRGTRARARRSTPRPTSSPTSSSPRTPTHQTRRCAPGPASSRRLQCAQLSVGPAATRATGAHAAGAHVHACRPLPRLPQLQPRREARRTARAQRSPSARATSPPRLFC